MNAEAILRDYISLCEETRGVLVEENRLLRATHSLPDPSLLERKRELISQIQQTNHSLRELNGGGVHFSPAARDLARTARNGCLRTLLLDRENEQLLFQTIMPRDG